MRSFILATALGAWALAATPPSAIAAEGGAATIRVNLPADATLTVDGQATRATSATRWFTTPALTSGKRYTYTFKASFVRDGRTITVEQKVPVLAGRQSVVSLDVSGTGSAGFAAAPGTGVNQNYYYNPQAPAAPATARNYYYAPPYYAPYAPSYGGMDRPAPSSEWVPGGYKTYNP